jgi:hypothetical protein|tara:strand:- start:423 stop:560 length:138 start_codon:yes stop_codon:yes gene_type:complete
LIRPFIKNWNIKSWIDSWVLFAGANSIFANLDGIDENGKGKIEVS